MLALFALGTVSVDKGSNISALRLVGWVLSTPLLIVAVLSIAGEDNSNVLLLVYFGLVFSMLVLSVGEWEYSSDYNGNTISVVYMTFWLCIIPFIVYSSKRLHFMAVEIPVSLPKWSIASLGIILGWYVIGAIVSTFHEIMNAHNNNNAKLLLAVRNSQLLNSRLPRRAHPGRGWLRAAGGRLPARSPRAL